MACRAGRDAGQDQRVLIAVYQDRLNAQNVTGGLALLPKLATRPRMEMRQPRLARGIERYLEKYPDGGYYQGSLYVFDKSQASCCAAEPPAHAT